MLKIKVERGKRCIKITINEHKPVVEFNLISEEPKPSFEILGNELLSSLGEQQVKIKIVEEKEKIIITKKIGIKEIILGFGEKALPLNKRRSRLVFWNYDNYNYSWYSDPLYISIPFGIFVNENKAIGIFLNTPAFCIADLGLKEYDEAVFEIHDNSLEFYIIFGPKIEDVLKTYFEITGKPFLPPSWALGYQISRYSYFPQEYVIEIAKEFLKEIPLNAIYLDIDYMEDYKIFTWNESRFPNPKEMISKLHELGVKVITIIDPYIKIQKDYAIYEEAKEFSVLNKNKEAYTMKGWPGECIIPDFFNKETREWWAKKIKEFVEEYSIDGIWLDMNEPSVFNDIKSIREMFNDADKEYLISRLNEIVFFNKPLKPSIRMINFKPEHFYDRSVDPNALHRLDDGRLVEHRYVRNAYPYFQAKATFETLKSLLKRPFILSRSGYPGIQKYAGVWTGDISSTWEDLKLTISMLLNLSISGLTFCGSDIGGFVGRADYELIARWHQACAFMPLFRLHKDKGASEAEIYNLPSKYKNIIKEAIELRYKFLPYLWHLCIKAHLEGEPIIRPLCYDFQEEVECFYIEDEYLVGPYLLFAPIIEKGKEEREVYLPSDDWFDFWNGNIIQGGKYIKTNVSMPIFIRKNSAIPIKKGLLIFGEGEWDIYHGEDCKKTKIIFKNNILKQLYAEMDINEIIVLGRKLYSKDVKTLINNLGTKIIIENKINNIELINF